MALKTSVSYRHLKPLIAQEDFIVHEISAFRQELHYCKAEHVLQLLPLILDTGSANFENVSDTVFQILQTYRPIAVQFCTQVFTNL